MVRKASPETQLRVERREVARLRKELSMMTATSAHYRQRATQAEQEVAEWKRRFDALLTRTPAQPPSEEAK